MITILSLMLVTEEPERKDILAVLGADALLIQMGLLFVMLGG